MNKLIRSNWSFVAAAVMCGTMGAGALASEPGDSSGGSKHSEQPEAPKGRTIGQMLEAVGMMVHNAAGLTGNQMWSLVDAIQHGQGDQVLPGAGTELGGATYARLDQIVADGKAHVDGIVGNITSQLTGGDVPAGLVDALNQIAAAGDAAIDENAKYARIALARALSGGEKPKPAVTPTPEKPKDSIEHPSGDSSKPAGGETHKSTKPVVKPKEIKPIVKPKPAQPPKKPAEKHVEKPKDSKVEPKSTNHT